MSPQFSLHSIASFPIIVRFCFTCILTAGAFPAWAAPAPVPVTAQPIEALVIQPVRDAPATAVSLNDTRVSAQITGTVELIPVQVGDQVEAGDVVAELDCKDYELAVRQERAGLTVAQARRKYAKVEVASAEKLAKTRSIAREKLEERRSDVAVAAAEVARNEASLAVAQRNTGKCRIRAPFQAVVVERLASVGELAMPGSPILRLLDLENIEIKAQAQEQDLAGLQASGLPEFVNRSHAYPLRLRVVLPILDSKARSYEVRLELAQQKAPPGATGRLTWQGGQRMLPANLLVRRQGGLGVFVAEQGQARFVPLPEARAGRPAVVDLADGVLVVVDGRFALEDGDALQLRDH